MEDTRAAAGTTETEVKSDTAQSAGITAEADAAQAAAEAQVAAEKAAAAKPAAAKSAAGERGSHNGDSSVPVLRPARRTVCVIGHKNPDTDSICSAISYTYLKDEMQKKEIASKHGGDDGAQYNYVACRAGQVSKETQYVLDYFGVEAPLLVENIGTRVKDMEIRQVPGVSSDISVKDAWKLMRSENVFTLPILDKDQHLRGLITTNDIAKSYMDEDDSAIVSTAHTPYRNILKTLDAKMVVGDPDGCFDQGKVIIAAANPDVMENYIDPHDMVILGNRYESQLMCIEMNAGCIVVCLGSTVSRTIQYMAKDHGTTIIVTPLDTYAAARLINQSMPIDFFMKKDNLITFHTGDYTDMIRDVMSSKRYRDFPILDQKGRYIGMISRRNLLGVRKRALILVDHNEVSQAVDNVLSSEILEIIDHHRLGSLETINPVYFRNQPVGCTATIIYQMFMENDIAIPKHIAGLLVSAILSDTLVFRSPTCTWLDREAAKALAAIAGIEPVQYAKDMFTAGSDLADKTPEEIFYTDFKTFEVEDQKITMGIGQITSMNQSELDSIAERLKPFIESVYKRRGLSLALFMLTNIIDESTTMLCYGARADQIMQSAFGAKTVDHVAVLPGVVSRKKQVVPAVISVLNRDNEA